MSHLDYHAEIYTGIRPTSDLTIGNYAGAIKDIVELQEEFRPVVFVADVHALTDQPTDVVERHRVSLLADWIALGLDLDRSEVYMQSHIIGELGAMTLLLSREVTVKQLFSVATTKDNLSTPYPNEEGVDAVVLSEGENMMFATYPTLMAADILSQRSKYVPVGRDQGPHIEFTREVARLFNRRHGDVLPMPEQWGLDVGREPIKVLALRHIDGKEAKMSKSNPATAILFTDDVEVTRKKIMGAQTGMPGEMTGQIESLITLARSITPSVKDATAIEAEFERIIEEHKAGGSVMGDFKKLLSDVVITFMEEYKEKRVELDENPSIIMDALSDGNKTAKKTALETLDAMEDAMKMKYDSKALGT